MTPDEWADITSCPEPDSPQRLPANTRRQMCGWHGLQAPEPELTEMLATRFLKGLAA